MVGLVLDVTVGGADIGRFLMSLLRRERRPGDVVATVSVNLNLSAGDEADTLSMEYTRPPDLVPPSTGDIVVLGFGIGSPVGMGIYKVDKPSSKTGKSGRTISITATAADMSSSIKSQRQESPKENERTIDKVVGRVAARHGLQPVVAEAFKGMPAMSADQTAESDMAYVRRLAKDVGADSRVVDGRLIFVERGSGTTASGLPMLPILIGDEQITEASWQGGERDAEEGVEATWYDREAGERKVVRAGAEGGKRMPRMFADKASAKRAAEAELGRAKASSDTCSVTYVNGPQVRPNDIVMLPELEPEYFGLWTVRTANYRVQKSGITTTISNERPGAQNDGEEGGGETDQAG